VAAAGSGGDFRVQLSFFFSSRRRHTRWPRDWSSDVCSSDLQSPAGVQALQALGEMGPVAKPAVPTLLKLLQNPQLASTGQRWGRSEERRVGKECRCRGAPDE